MNSTYICTLSLQKTREKLDLVYEQKIGIIWPFSSPSLSDERRKLYHINHNALSSTSVEWQVMNSGLGEGKNGQVLDYSSCGHRSVPTSRATGTEKLC